MARITQAMLERALGGADILVQMLDRDGDGTADSAAITDILNEADGLANSYIALAVDISDTTIDTAPVLLKCELDCAVYSTWLRGTMAQAMPEAVRIARDDAVKWFGDVRDRRAGLGLATRPTTSQIVQQVTKDDDEDYFVSTSPRQRFNGWA